MAKPPEIVALETALASAINASLHVSAPEREAFIAKHLIAVHEGRTLPHMRTASEVPQKKVSAEELKRLSTLLTRAVNACRPRVNLKAVGELMKTRRREELLPTWWTTAVDSKALGVRAPAARISAPRPAPPRSALQSACAGLPRWWSGLPSGPSETSAAEIKTAAPTAVASSTVAAGDANTIAPYGGLPSWWSTTSTVLCAFTG